MRWSNGMVSNDCLAGPGQLRYTRGTILERCHGRSNLRRPTFSPRSCAGTSHSVYEDDAVIAFMDVMPQGPGHTLVLPKAPSRNLLDADPATLGPL